VAGVSRRFDGIAAGEAKKRVSGRNLEFTQEISLLTSRLLVG
jgi:hypothetical protein